MFKPLTRGRPDDEGAILIFALIAVLIMMAISTSLLTVSSANFRATGGYTDEASTSSAADGATQIAANTIRRTLYNAGAGQHCFPNSAVSLTSGSDTLDLTNMIANGGRTYSASITCTHAPGSSSPVLINATNRPGMAILTTGGSTYAAQGEPGISIKALNAVPFKVHGVIYSNSTVTQVSGTLVDDNGVYARGACSGASSITPTPVCGFGNSPPTGTPDGSTPSYAAATTTVPTYQGSITYGSSNTSLPINTNNWPTACKNTVVTFQPGYYDDAVGLSTLMSSSGCAGSTFWFKPGNYYFDFHNGDDSVLTGSSHVWTVGTGYLVAGTPATANRQPVNPAPSPGSCVSPISKDNSTTDQGAQFIFGGDSQLVVGSASAEICGTYSSTAPPIAVFGVTGTADETQTSQPTLQMNSTADNGNFVNVNGMRTISDSSIATWTDNANGNGSRTGSATVTGYVPATTPPLPGAVVDQAQLTVRHGNSAGTTQDSPSVKITMPDNTNFTVPLTGYGDNALHTEVVDFSTNATFLKYVHANGLSSALQMTYSSTVKHKGTESVDAITLALKYRNPAFRSQSLATIHGVTNCLTAPYTGTGSAACAAITSAQSPNNSFYIQGTAFEPNAAMDVSLNQATSQVFKFGVVARSLQIKVTGSSTFDQPVIEIPDDSPGNVISTNVILSTYVCAGSSPCSTSGSPTLRARVALVDPDPGAVLIGLRALVVQTWSTPARSGG
jgi:hypothetical protein